MLGSVTAVLWAALVAWLIFRAARQFQAYQVLRPDPPSAGAGLPAVTVVVPARNEADAIGRCLAGLAAQDYPADRLHVVVVDDGSTDGTGALARRFAADDPRFRVIEAGPLPAGWVGKPHACWQGVRSADGAWLCFLDADTEPGPALLRTAVAEAERQRFDLLSLEPMQELKSVWERLVIPAGLFVLAIVRDLRRSNDPGHREAVANGQFLLIRRTVYDRVGGHAAVRATVAEDSMLAGMVKAAGFRYALLGGAPLIRTRMYRSLTSLWEGLSKNCVETLGGVGATVLAGVLGVAFAWAAVAVPAWLVAAAVAAPMPLPIAAATLALLASLAVLGLHAAGAYYLAIPGWYGALFPAAYTLAALLAVSGLAKRHNGRVDWKGRTYTAGREPTPGSAG